jgi:hypothetical protein
VQLEAPAQLHYKTTLGDWLTSPALRRVQAMLCQKSHCRNTVFHNVQLQSSAGQRLGSFESAGRSSRDGRMQADVAAFHSKKVTPLRQESTSCVLKRHQTPSRICSWLYFRCYSIEHTPRDKPTAYLEAMVAAFWQLQAQNTILKRSKPLLSWQEWFPAEFHTICAHILKLQGIPRCWYWWLNLNMRQVSGDPTRPEQ